MKNVATTLAGRVSRTLGVLLLLVASSILGCSETEEPLEPAVGLAENAEVGVFAQEKYNDGAPAAPTAPVPVGTPFVKEVVFYRDWQLTKPVTKPVPVGTQLWIKVVFSEPMKHVVSDEKAARPLIYHKRGGKGQELIKFNMADHGAGGEDFSPGDAKPFQSGTDDYICKYVVTPEDEGKEITFMVGKWSVDLEGNPLAAFYRHPVKLEVQRPAPPPKPRKPRPEPIEEVMVDEPGETVAPTGDTPPAPILPREIEYASTPIYYWGDGTTVVGERLPPSAWVLNFPGPFRHYPPPHSNPNDFVGRVAMPVGGADADNWARAGKVAPVEKVIVTITRGNRTGEQVMTNEGGYYVFKNMTDNELYLRVERAYLEPKEVIVSRSRPTRLQRMRRNHVFLAQHHVAERTPGTILMGLRWPDAVRFILQDETMPQDVLCIMAPEMILRGEIEIAGIYERMLVVVSNDQEEQGEAYHSTLTHELAHARQHAVATQHGGSSARDWESTPEGRAYKVALEKDLREAPGMLYLIDDHRYFQVSMLENAAEFCSEYWNVRADGLDDYFDGSPLESLKTRAPNRFKWAETYLNTKY